MKNKKKLIIIIVGIIVVVGSSICGSIAYSSHKQDVYNKKVHKEKVAKLNKTASNLSKEITTCDSYSTTSADRHKKSEVSTYITAIANATNTSEESNTQEKLDKAIKDLSTADTLFRSEEKTQPAQLFAMAKIATKKKKDNDNLRANYITQMNALLNKNEFSEANQFISGCEALNKDEIKNLGAYIDGKQQYFIEVQDDADHPEYVAPNSSGNYVGVAVWLYSVNPDYQGIYANEIKNFVHKFTNDEKWEKGYADAEVSNAQIEDQANSPEPAIGMTSDEVLSSKWGNPNKKNVTTTADGTSEQWVYDSYGYVYLDNGIVTTIQTN